MYNKNNPLVSAIIPTHNRAKILPAAIESVLAQTYKNIEIIIIDDGSKDDTKEIIDDYRQRFSNFIYLRHEIARGACAARNSGIKAASGEFIAGLDDDDEWLPERIEKMLEKYSDEYAFVYSESFNRQGNKNRIEKRPPFVTFEEMIKGRNLAGTQVLVRKNIIMEAGGFDERLPASQDYDMWLRILEIYPKAIGVNIPLMVRHTSDRVNRISSNKWSKFRGRFKVYKKHKHRMSRDLRRSRLYKIRKILHPRPTLKTVLSLSPDNIRLKELKKFILNRIKAMHQNNWHPF